MQILKKMTSHVSDVFQAYYLVLKSFGMCPQIAQNDLRLRGDRGQHLGALETPSGVITLCQAQLVRFASGNFRCQTCFGDIMDIRCGRAYRRPCVANQWLE